MRAASLLGPLDGWDASATCEMVAAGTDLAPAPGLGWPAGQWLDAGDCVEDEDEDEDEHEDEGEGERFAPRAEGEHEDEEAASASREDSAESVAQLRPAVAALDLVLALVVALVLALALPLVLDQVRGGG